MHHALDLIDDRPDEGASWVHRDVFRDPAIFEPEMARVFERDWPFPGQTPQRRTPSAMAAAASQAWSNQGSPAR